MSEQQPNSQGITEDLLRAAGFKWHEVQNKKHWLLWIADALPRPEVRACSSCEDLGIELAPWDASVQSWWFVWLCADYAGRYSRLVCVGHYWRWDQLLGLIAGLTGRPLDPADALYGVLRRPEMAGKVRAADDDLHMRLAKDWGKRVDQEEGKKHDPDQMPKNGGGR